jgi:fluoride exporter
MSVAAWCELAALGGVGAVLRFAIDGAVGGRLETSFPAGTLLVNASGTFALGILTGTDVAGTTLFVVGTGLLGSFTTFSTWMFETLRLAEDGEARLSVANLVISLLGGVAAGGAGWALGALL